MKKNDNNVQKEDKRMNPEPEVKKMPNRADERDKRYWKDFERRHKSDRKKK